MAVLLDGGSGGGTGTAGHGLVPALHRGVIRRHVQLERLGKVHCHQGGNVRGRVALAGDERHLPQPLVEVGEEVLHAQHTPLDQRRNLLIVMGSGDGAALQPRNLVADAFHHGREAFQLGTPLPHKDQALVLGRGAQQGVYEKRFVEITHDGRHLADGGAILLQDQGWYYPARIDLPVGFGVLLTLAEVNSDERTHQALLSHENPHASRIRRGRRMVRRQGIGGHGGKPLGQLQCGRLRSDGGLLLKCMAVLWRFMDAGGTQQPQSLEPPSTCTVSPVIQRASSDARKATTGAMSSGWATRFSACMPSVASRPASVLAKLDMSVSTTPGATALTRMPRGPRTEAKCLTSVSTAPLVAA